MSSPPIKQTLPMSLDGLTIHREKTLKEAIRHLEENKVRSLLVIDSEGNGVGVLSEGDIVKAFAKLGDDAKNKMVSRFMTIDLVVAEDSADIDFIIKLMALNNVRHMPVVNDLGKVVSFVNVLQILMAKIES